MLMICYFRRIDELYIKWTSSERTVREENHLNNKIRVDRQYVYPYPFPYSVRITPEEYCRRVLHYREEKRGLSEYYMSRVELWYPDRPPGIRDESRKIDGDAWSILDPLQRVTPLYQLLAMQDALAIQAMGREFFRKYFAGMTPWFLRSVVLDDSGRPHAPYLQERKGDILVDWGLITLLPFDRENPILRFKPRKSKTKT